MIEKTHHSKFYPHPLIIDAEQPFTHRPMKATLLNILLTVGLIKVTSFSSTTMQQHTCQKDDTSYVTVFMPKSGSYQLGKRLKSTSTGVSVELLQEQLLPSFSSEESPKKVILNSLERSRITSACLAPSKLLPLHLSRDLHAISATHCENHYTIIHQTFTPNELDTIDLFFSSKAFQASLTSVASVTGLQQKDHQAVRITKFRRDLLNVDLIEGDQALYLPEWIRKKLTRLMLESDKQSTWRTVLPEDREDVYNLNRYEIWYNEYEIQKKKFNKNSTQAIMNTEEDRIDREYGDNYKGWHVDEAEDWVEYKDGTPRALSMVIHLEDRGNYEGGKFWASVDGRKNEELFFQRGDAIGKKF